MAEIVNGSANLDQSDNDSAQIGSSSQAEETPRTIEIPYGNDWTKDNLDEYLAKDPPVMEVPTITLSALGEKIDKGCDGRIFVLKKDPSIVVKLFYRRGCMIAESHKYLHAQSLNDPAIPMPQFRRIYYIPSHVFDAHGLAFSETASDDTSDDASDDACNNRPFYPYCIGMERIEGNTLEDYVRNTESCVEDFIHLEKILKMELKKLHGAGIVHFDIHSQNIMLYSNPLKALFVDFTRGELSQNERDFDYDEEVLDGVLDTLRYECF